MALIHLLTIGLRQQFRRPILLVLMTLCAAVPILAWWLDSALMDVLFPISGFAMAIVLIGDFWSSSDQQSLRRWLEGCVIAKQDLWIIGLCVRLMILAVVMSASVGIWLVLGEHGWSFLGSAWHLAPLLLQFTVLCAILVTIFKGSEGVSLGVVLLVAGPALLLAQGGTAISWTIGRWLGALFSPFLWENGLERQLGPILVVCLLLAGGWVVMRRRENRLSHDAGRRQSDLLRVRRLSVRYSVGLARKPVQAVQEAEFSVPCGCVVGLLGPNGAGKTSVMNALVDRVQASGEACWSGTVPVTRRIVPEDVSLPSRLRVDEMQRLLGATQAPDKLDYLADSLGIDEIRHKRTFELSSGQRRRLGLFLGLASDAQLYMVDEPAQGVDPIRREGVKSALRRVVSDHRTVLVSTHQLREFEEVLDYVIFLVEGTVVRHGALREVLDRVEGIRFESVMPEFPGAHPDRVVALSKTLLYRRNDRDWVLSQISDKGGSWTVVKPSLHDAFLFESGIERLGEE